MIATVHLGSVELAELLREYCEARGFIYVEHGITEDFLIDMKIELPARAQQTPARAPADVQHVPPTRPSAREQTDDTQLSLADLMSTEGAPVDTRDSAASAGPEHEHDQELADLFTTALRKEDF